PEFLAKHRRFKFLWHCPSAGLAAWPPAYIPFPPPYVGGCRLRGIAPFGVRTFLPHPARAGWKRSSALPKSKNSLQVIGPRTESKLGLGIQRIRKCDNVRLVTVPVRSLRNVVPQDPRNIFLKSVAVDVHVQAFPPGRPPNRDAHFPSNTVPGQNDTEGIRFA